MRGGSKLVFSGGVDLGCIFENSAGGCLAIKGLEIGGFDQAGYATSYYRLLDRI